MKRSAFTIFAVVIFLSISLEALADGAINLEIEKDKILIGRDNPAIILSSIVDLKNARLILNRSDGKRIKLNSGPVKADADYRFTWKQPAGNFHYIGKLHIITVTGETGDMNASFTITGVAAKKIKITVPAEKREIKDDTLWFMVDRTIKKAEIEVFGETGGRMAYEIKEYPELPKPGTLVNIKWDSGKKEIMRMVLKVWDKEEFWNKMEFFPWKIDIPHDEVNFETGKWEILAKEEPKLLKALKVVQAALKKYGRFGNPKLYVAGYTDTVGGAGSNFSLSHNRARSIAKWYRGKGLKMPIYYQGFGESVLAKETPDETDEILNRRALYIIAAERPYSKNFPGGRPWTRLK